ncbi:MAG: hypothetical protein OXJ52_04300 [Oligoflexia bacterium]|nr:hypothetical protein [Oligoflexia bacterium]
MKVAFVFLVFLSPNLQARLVESLKAQVGEEVISQIDLNNFKLQLKQNLVPSSLLLKTLYSPSQLLKNEKDRLSFMIETRLLSQMAQQQKFPLDETRLNKELKSLQGALSKTRFSKKLKRVGLTLESLKKSLNENSQIDRLLSQVVLSKITVSDQDIESYHFTKYKKPLFKVFEYEFTALSFPENKKNQVLKAQRENPLKSLEELSQSLNLEYKKSQLKEDQIRKMFKKELDKLSVSQFSPLLFSENTYYLLQLKWKAPFISPKEKIKKDQIEKQIFEKKLKQELRRWIEEQKSQFFIKIFL